VSGAGRLRATRTAIDAPFLEAAFSPIGLGSAEIAVSSERLCHSFAIYTVVCPAEFEGEKSRKLRGVFATQPVPRYSRPWQ
jgi:hypothetical protein